MVKALFTEKNSTLGALLVDCDVCKRPADLGYMLADGGQKVCWDCIEGKFKGKTLYKQDTSA